MKRRVLAAVSVYDTNWHRPFGLSMAQAGASGLGVSQTGPSAWEDIKSKVSGNTGNLAWAYAVNQLVDTESIHHLLHNHTHILRGSSSEGDIVGLLMGTGPMLGDSTANAFDIRFDYMLKFSQQVKGPQLILGMGSLTLSKSCNEGLEAKSKQFVEKLLTNMEKYGGYVTLRGQCTQDMIASSGIPIKHFPVMGCPSYLLSRNPQLGKLLQSRYQKLVAQIEPSKETSCLRIGILTAAGANLDAMMSFVRKYSCDNGTMHLLQDNYDQGVASVVQEKAGPQVHIVAEQYYDILTWQMNVKGLDIVVGPRIHGSMVPLSMGIPTITIAKDIRIDELCQSMDLACMKVFSDSESFLSNLLSTMKNFDGTKFDENRFNKLTKYREIFDELGMGLHPGLVKQLKPMQPILIHSTL